MAFASNRSGEPEIWTSSADGGGAQRVTDMEAAFLTDLDWSPEGSIVFGICRRAVAA